MHDAQLPGNRGYTRSASHLNQFKFAAIMIPHHVMRSVLKALPN